MLPVPPGKPPDNLRAHTILIVDDEPLNVEAFEFNFAREFTVRSATDAADARQQIATGNIAVVIADHKMPGESGLDLLTWVARAHPSTVRILLTAYSEVDLLQDALNRGVLFRFAKKPWKHRELKHDLMLAIAERNALLHREAAARANTLDAIAEGMQLMARHVTEDVVPLLDRMRRIVDRASQGGKGSKDALGDLAALLDDVQGHFAPLARSVRSEDAAPTAVDLGAMLTGLVEVARSGATASGVELRHEPRQVWAELPARAGALETTLLSVLERSLQEHAGARGQILELSAIVEDEGTVGIRVAQLPDGRAGLNGNALLTFEPSLLRQLRLVVEAMRGRVELEVDDESRATLSVLLPASLGPDAPAI